ncbi:4-alpha-glucanotransferase (amylomaltase) [hydrothermal vent metagenome]|uniref:4-alpha-glucanotransferase n=1 Tax=hydrothermal vent metagenome TaxID=652676 RepID=A0A3B0WER6_9ZZZZ
MRFKRAAGILLHPTSFPSRYGIGDFGDAAYQFVNFLVASKQSLWQVLPLGPTGYGDSPYQSFSAFAGNPLLISPDRLVQDGFLPETACPREDVGAATIPPFPQHEVDFGAVIPYKNKLLQQAHEHFLTHGTAVQQTDYQQFCSQNGRWLDDYALFMALKNHHVAHEGGVWNSWPREIAMRQPEAMVAWSKKLANEVDQHKFLQFLFFQQWLALKAYANERGIQIIGDIPIFAAFDSADVWANRDLFYLDDDGAATVIAGVPPDYFSETGQRWGNPLYRWDRMADDGYAWWAARLQMCFVQADIVRIDHFRGFDAYWEIPASEPTAVIGKWVKGPGAAFFQAMRDKLGDLPLIAEDLGVITPEVIVLREAFDFPGMKILQFAFGGEQNSAFLPHTFAKNTVVYTGTHDNETTLGWYRNASGAEQDHVRRYIGISGQDIAWDLTRLAFMSVSNTAVATLQDLMNLGNEARMNFPGKVGGYWRWRYLPQMLTQDIATRLREMTEIYGRVPSEQ